MQTLDVVRLAALIAAFAASASKLLPSTLPFWEKRSPTVSRWFPGFLLVLGALPAALAGVSTWEQFALAVMGAAAFALPGTHRNQAAPLKGPPVGEERVSLRPPPKPPSIPPLAALLALCLLLLSCGGSQPNPQAVAALAPVVCQAALLQQRFEPEQVQRLCADSAVAARLATELTNVVMLAVADATQPKADIDPGGPGTGEGGTGGAGGAR
jgi:hypothetical protein